MRLISFLVVRALLPAGFFATNANDLMLAENGKTDYQIVMLDKYPAPEIGERLKRVVLLIQAEFKSDPMDRF